ncbi:unnamed protein product, partial [Iphiclides podalirius]
MHRSERWYNICLRRYLSLGNVFDICQNISELTGARTRQSRGSRPSLSLALRSAHGSALGSALGSAFGSASAHYRACAIHGGLGGAQPAAKAAHGVEIVPIS